MLFYVRVVYLILQLHLSSQTFDCFLASSAAVKNVTEGEDINLMSYKSSLVAFFYVKTIAGLPGLCSISAYCRCLLP